MGHTWEVHLVFYACTIPVYHPFQVQVYGTENVLF